MKLICAVVILSLVPHVAKGAPSSNSSRKATIRDVSNRVASNQHPVIWNKHIGTILDGQEVPSLYCCNMPVQMQSCVCCASLCFAPQPSIPPIIVPPIPPHPVPPIPPPPLPLPLPPILGCCHLPEALQECWCCPNACRKPPPPPNCCYLPASLQDCNCCPSACYPPPLEDCCNLPEPFRNCQCCPSACNRPTVPFNMSCCHWPKFLQNCDCCVINCQIPPGPPPFPGGCCNLPKELQDCRCCPSACKDVTTPDNFGCCHLPEKEQHCGCCPSACRITTPPDESHTHTEFDCCSFPKEYQTCECCPQACKTTPTSKTTATPKTTSTWDCCLVPENERDCDCCPSACESSTTTPELQTTLEESTTTETSYTPHSCCHLPKKYQNCNCCPSGCTEETTVITTTANPSTSLSCCHMPKEFQDCYCCPSLCEETSTDASSTTEETTLKTLSTIITATDEVETRTPTDEGESTTPTSEGETTTLIDNKSSTTESSSVLTTTPSFDCCDFPKEQQSCTCCPSACTTPPNIPHINCCNWPKHLQRCSCCSYICPGSHITPEQISCCYLPQSMQSCWCCITSVHCTHFPAKKGRARPSTCCHLPPEQQECHCCSTAPSCGVDDDASSCCHLPEDEQNCVCCPSNCVGERFNLAGMLESLPIVYEELLPYLLDDNIVESGRRISGKHYPETYWFQHHPKFATFIGRSQLTEPKLSVKYSDNSKTRRKCEDNSPRSTPDDLSADSISTRSQNNVNSRHENDQKDDLTNLNNLSRLKMVYGKILTSNKRPEKIPNIESKDSDKQDEISLERRFNDADSNTNIELIPTSKKDEGVAFFRYGENANDYYPANILSSLYANSLVTNDRIPYYEPLLQNDRSDLETSVDIDEEITPAILPPNLLYKSLILNKLARLAAGMDTNQGEFVESKNTNGILHLPYLYDGSEDMYNFLLSNSPQYDDSVGMDNLDNIDELYPDVEPYIANRLKNSHPNRYTNFLEILDAYIRRKISRKISGPVYAIKELKVDKDGPSKDYVGNSDSIRNSGVTNKHFYPQRVDSSPLKISLEAAILDLLVKLEELKGYRQKLNKAPYKNVAVSKSKKQKNYSPDSSAGSSVKPQGRLTATTIAMDGLSRSTGHANVKTRTELVRVKKSSIQADESLKVPKSQNILCTTKAAVKQKGRIKLARQRANQDKFFTPPPFGPGSTLQYRTTDQSHEMKKKRKFGVSTLRPTGQWPIVYGTKDATELTNTQEYPNNPVVFTTPSVFDGQENSNVDSSSSLILVIPQMIPFHNPSFNPYFRPPLNFPMQYCLFDQFNPLCRQMLADPMNAHLIQEYQRSRYPYQLPKAVFPPGGDNEVGYVFRHNEETKVVDCETRSTTPKDDEMTTFAATVEESIQKNAQTKC